ncbi:hypothetical protein ACHAXT_000879 [Thalassiosira profunda]
MFRRATATCLRQSICVRFKDGAPPTHLRRHAGCAACFSSSHSPQMKVREQLAPAADPPRIIDAAAHAEFARLKEARREAQMERYQQAEAQRGLARRKLLAEGLMRIFAARGACFNLILKELNIRKKWGSDEGLDEYRQFYLDSLPGFAKMLAEDFDNGSVLSEVGLGGASVARMLDDFEGGRDRNDAGAFTRRYLKMCRMVQSEEEHQSNLAKLRKKHEARLLEAKEEEEVLKSMEAEQFQERDERVASLNSKVSSVKEMLPSLASAGDIGDSYIDELDKLEAELSKALSQVAKLSKSRTEKDLEAQRQKAKKARKEAEDTSKRIAKTEEKIAGFEYPMDKAEYEENDEKILAIASAAAPALAKFITNRHDDFDRYRQLDSFTDLTRPHEWYPRARLDKRKVIFHGGPTNSGKTYAALQRLKQAERGMYLAPLRLLAAETYETLTHEGVYCSLRTGQEKRDVPFSTHRSSTVELADLDADYDVVVLDEIQMLGDEFRGFAWTRALLGVRCKEIHVCGGKEAENLVRRIVAMTGDDFEMHTYERFSDLKVLPDSLAKSSTSKGSYSNVQPGDCVVAFSKNDIFAIRREIENTTDHKCCVIYGSLPPEVRAEQARRFNDPASGYDVLVASDAIGMGLNLSIKRVIFNTMFKNNGVRIVQLDHSAVKQIAGRAGRRNSPYPHGEVTCRDPADMAHLKKCMRTEIRPVQKAGLVPTENHIALFTKSLEEYGAAEKTLELHQTLRKFSEMATLKGDFFLCREDQLHRVSDWLKDIPMDASQKYSLCLSPVRESCPHSKRVLMKYVESYTHGKVPGVLHSMRPRPAKSLDKFSALCNVHHQLDLFVWLQNKLPTNAVEVARANTFKERASELINKGLLNAEKLSLEHCYVAKDLRVKKHFADENEGAD